MRRLLLLAMRVERLAELANTLLLGLRRDGKRERIEAGCLVVARAILERAARCERPCDVAAARHDAEIERVIETE